MPNIKLLSSDGKTFEKDEKTLHCSTTIKTMLEDLGSAEGEVIPLPKVNALILEKIIEWAEHHKDDQNEKKLFDDGIDSWDEEFLKVDRQTLFDLILAANFLDIKGLLKLTTKKVANMNKGKTPEEIRKFYDIKGDFTPAEEIGQDQRKKNERCKDKGSRI